MKNLTSPHKSLVKYAVAAFAAAAFSVPGLVMADSKITPAMIEEAQQKWTDGLIAVSKANRDGGDPKARAVEMLDELYNFDGGEVLFKPTLTYGDRTFRPTKEAALAYFVGGNPNFPSDTGFALSPFESARFKIEHTFIDGDVAIAMGNVWIKDVDGNETKVDKTFAYVLDNGKLRIVTHHSSLPFVSGEGVKDTKAIKE